MGKVFVRLSFFIIFLLSASCFLYKEEDAIPDPSEFTEDVKLSFSLESGYYNNEQIVTITTNRNDAEIYYSLDGSAVAIEAFTIKRTGGFLTGGIPPLDDLVENTAAIKYTGPITISSTSLLRARAFYGNAPVSRDFSNMYFINESITFPVFSITMDPLDLWDDYRGIYTFGPGGYTEQLYAGQNYYKDWERQAHVEFFETDHSYKFEMDLGVKTFGGGSRTFPQKSLALFPRSEYGKPVFEYDFFNLTDNLGNPISYYYSLVLRNSGDDFYRTMFRDGFLQSLIGNLDLEQQAYRPGIVFLNGQYWGIQNIREKVNEAYLASHFDYVDPDQVDILTQYNSEVLEGDSIHFENMLAFAEDNDLSITANYNQMLEWMDMDNFIDYTIFNLYINNTDWPFSNIKYWRPKTATGKWRWIVYDTDSGFGGKEWDPVHNAVDYNTLNFLLSSEAGSDYRTLFINLLANTTFKTAFVTRFQELLGSNFSEATILAKLNSMSAVVAPEIARHRELWGTVDKDGGGTDWLDYLDNFARTRDNFWGDAGGILDNFNTEYSNILRNGAFAQNTYWDPGWATKRLHYDFDSDDILELPYTADISGGVCTVTILSGNPNNPTPATNGWSDIVFMLQDHLKLAAGSTYTITFDAHYTGSGPVTMGISLVKPEPFAVYVDHTLSEGTQDSIYRLFDLTNSSTTYTIKSVALPAAEPGARLLFVAGKVALGQTFVIDNVTLTTP